MSQLKESSPKDTTLIISRSKVREIIEYTQAARKILKGEEGATRDRPPPVRAPLHARPRTLAERRTSE